MVEHLLCKQGVRSSNLRSSTSLIYSIFIMEFVIGIVLSIITILIHRSTFLYDKGEGKFKRAYLSVGLIIAILIVGLIPYVNFAAFTLGGIIYVGNILLNPNVKCSLFKDISGLEERDNNNLIEKISDFLARDLGRKKKE